MEELRTSSRLLVQVITGGRPLLSERPTSKLLPELAEIADVEYCIREDHIEGYETDGFAFNPYTVDFANEYARTHWRHPMAEWSPGGFFGAFPGREWAALSAERRRYDAVLQLDDNITHVGPVYATRDSYREGITSIAEMSSILAELSASTNASMLGMQLNTVIAPKQARILRAGYPYSFFIEKVGPGRLPYFGPFEDDIMHALEYALHGGPGRTAAVVDSLTYRKEPSSKSGMRSHYNPHRGMEIARRYRKNVKIIETKRTSNPVETEKGIRHVLNTKGFTPVRIEDSKRYRAASRRLAEIVALGSAATREANRQKMLRRAGLA